MTGRTPIPRRGVLLGAGAVLLLGIGASGVLPGLAEAVAYLSPALLLLLVLVARRYPGERALLALMERRRETRRPADADERARLPGLRAFLPRGGRLIATSLAVRPPPAGHAVALT
jgi:hypothetical protein